MSIWLIWKKVPRDDGTGRNDKKPIYPSNGQLRHGDQGRPEDRAQRVTYDQAQSAKDRHKLDGVSTAPLPGDHVVGLDLDHVLDEKGELKDHAKGWYEKIKHTYVERSPSGDGLHAIFSGDAADGKNNVVGLELFCNNAHLTFTGNPYKGSHDDIAEWTPGLETLFRPLIGAKEARDKKPDTELKARKPEECLAAIEAIPNAVRNWDYYLDLGLAVKAALAEDGKQAWLDWCAKLGKENNPDANRKKWPELKPNRIGAGWIYFEAVKAGWKRLTWKYPDAITELEWHAAELTPTCIVERYKWYDVASLIAPGGTGKTTLMLYEAIHIALGLPLYGRKVLSPGSTLIITAEDARERLVARLREICFPLGLTEAQEDVIRRDVRISDVSGSGFRLTIVDDDVVLPSATVDRIIAEAKELAPVEVVLDPMVSFGIGEGRVNDAEQGLIEAARRIRDALKCCVRYIHHTGKANSRENTVDQYSGRGGSALPDGCRMVAVYQPMTVVDWAKETRTQLPESESAARLALPKLSYCPPQPDILIKRKGYKFEWSIAGPKLNASGRAEANAHLVLEKIREQVAIGGHPTRNTLESDMLGLMTRVALREAVRDLLAKNQIEEAELDPEILSRVVYGDLIRRRFSDDPSLSLRLRF